MGGSCAACLQPLVHGVKYVLVGTEVIHSSCARAGMQTLVQKLQSQLSLARQESARWQSEAATARYELRIANALGDELETARSGVARLERQAARMLQERNEALAARDAAKRELALRDAIGTPRVATPDATETQRAEDKRDATEVRFSLLELDPL